MLSGDARMGKYFLGILWIKEEDFHSNGTRKCEAQKPGIACVQGTSKDALLLLQRGAEKWGHLAAKRMDQNKEGLYALCFMIY